MKNSGLEGLWGSLNEREKKTLKKILRGKTSNRKKWGFWVVMWFLLLVYIFIFLAVLMSRGGEDCRVASMGFAGMMIALHVSNMAFWAWRFRVTNVFKKIWDVKMEKMSRKI